MTDNWLWFVLFLFAFVSCQADRIMKHQALLECQKVHTPAECQ